MLKNALVFGALRENGLFSRALLGTPYHTFAHLPAGAAALCCHMPKSAACSADRALPVLVCFSCFGAFVCFVLFCSAVPCAVVRAEHGSGGCARWAYLLASRAWQAALWLVMANQTRAVLRPNGLCWLRLAPARLGFGNPGATEPTAPPACTHGVLWAEHRPGALRAVFYCPLF